MSYTTIGAVTGSAWQVSGEGVDSAIVQFAIDHSEALIDTYCAGYYTVPFSSTPALVESMSIGMARILGQFLVGHNLTHFQEPEDKMWNFYMATLEKVRSGELIVPGATRLTADNRVWSNTMNYTPITNVDDPLNHVIDEDRLDDIGDDRD